jgi:hypothetical protein
VLGQPLAQESPAPIPEPQSPTSKATKPSRRAKLHIGGYYDPHDPIIITFQKLGIDLRRPQQDTLLEAIRDFVAKHEADRAFRGVPYGRQLPMT